MMTNKAEFQQIDGEVNPNMEYAKGFGELAHKTAYSGYPEHGMTNLGDNKAKMIDIPKVYQKHVTDIRTKALDPTTGTTPTNAGQVLVPVSVDREFTNLTVVETPLRTLIRRVSNQGLTADYNRITALGGGSFLGLGAAIPPSEETYTRAYVPLKYMYVRGGVLGQAEAGMAGFFSMGGMELEIMNKTNAMYQLEEDTIINGAIATDPLEFDGLITIVTAGGQTDNKAGAAISLDDIRAMATDIFEAKGKPSLIVTDGNTMDAVSKLLEDQYRQVDRVQGAFGMEAIMFHHYTGKIPMIVDYFMPTTAAGRAMLMLDMRHIEMRVLLDYTLVPLGITRDATEFFIKSYLALVVKAPTFQGIIYNIE